MSEGINRTDTPTRTHIDEMTFQKLKQLRNDTGVGPNRLLAGRKDIPAGLRSDIIRTWLNGAAKSARADHLEYVLALWEGADPCIPLSEDMRADLKREMERTGYKGKSLLNALAPVPEGLRPLDLNLWITGRVDKVRRSHLDFIREGLRSLPDRQRQ